MNERHGTAGGNNSAQERVEQLDLFAGSQLVAAPHPIASTQQPSLPTVVKGESKKCVTLPAADLRQVVRNMRASFKHVHGQDAAVDALTILAALHVGGGIKRGGRPLLIGPSGSGKTTLVAALVDALSPWGLPVAYVDAIELTGPGWSGAPSIGDVVNRALASLDVRSDRARKMVICIDEIHHARLNYAATGNMQSKQEEVLASLLPVVGGGFLHLDEYGRGIATEEMLVLSTGAFTGLDLSAGVSIDGLVGYGFPIELASRFDQVIHVRPLSAQSVGRMLATHPALVELVGLYRRFGVDVVIHEQTYARAAQEISGGKHGTPRTAVSWILTALRQHLSFVVQNENVRKVEITPDSLDIPPMRRLRPHPREESGEGDAGALT